MESQNETNENQATQNPVKQNQDPLVKVLLIGDLGVGKTCILLRYCENNFMPPGSPTIAIEFRIKTIDVDNKGIKFQIWDTAGQERFRTITQSYYKGAQIILTYACNDRKSFDSIEMWMEEAKKFSDEDVSMILVGSKSDTDMAERQVTWEEGKTKADSYGIKFYETSAKDDINVSETFETIAKEMIGKFEKKNDKPSNTEETADLAAKLEKL